MLRSERDPSVCWDLSAIFSDRKTWESACTDAESAIEKILPLKGTLAAGSHALKLALDTVNAALELVEKVYCWAYLYQSEDNGNPDAQEALGRAMSLLTKISTSASFIDPEILSLPEEDLKAAMESPELKNYRHMLDSLLRQRVHILDEAGEKILAALSEPGRTPSDAYDMLTAVDMRFPPVKVGNAEKELTHGNFNIFRENPSREVRVDAFEKFLGEYKGFGNTIAALYAGSVRFDCFYAQTRGYSGAREAALAGNQIPISVYDSLLTSVREAVPVLSEYNRLRAQKLGIDSMDMFDLYLPLFSENSTRVSYEESQKMVLEAMAPLGEEYGKLLKKAFAERWIDVYENKGKTTGAYSMGVYGVHPYILMNHTETLESAFTLAHELGHAMHSYFSNREQDYPNHDYAIFVAEVASTVNEVFLTRWLLEKETDSDRRAAILARFLESYRTTVFRQTIFAEFELRTHEICEKKAPLTLKVFNEIYRTLLSEYYTDLEIPEILSYEWAYIPHFYRPFYVYQYATGFCAAVSIVNKILETGDTSNYLKFLSLGGSDYPIEELKTVGIDLTGPEPVRNAMQTFRATLEELKLLVH